MRIDFPGRPSLILALATLLVAPRALEAGAPIQDPDFRPRPAASQVPPDVVAAEPPGTARQPSRTSTLSELLEQIRRQPGGAAKVDRAKGGRVEGSRPAAAAPPPEVAEQARSRPPRNPGPPSGIEELLDQVRRQAGGAAKVEAALRHAARGRGRSGTMAWSADELLGSEGDAVVQGYSLNLSPSNNWYVSSGNRATFNGVRVDSYRLSNYSKSTNWGTFGHRVENPVVLLVVTVPRTDYYVVNFMATDALAELRRYDPATRSYPVEGSWDRRGAQGWFFDYPALIPLSQGTHYLYWVLRSGDASVVGVSVRQLTG